MKNHWLEEKKNYVKIFDNTKTDEQYAGRVPKTAMWTLRAEIDDQFWFDRLDRQLLHRNRTVAQEEPQYPPEWSIPTQPGQ